MAVHDAHGHLVFTLLQVNTSCAMKSTIYWKTLGLHRLSMSTR